MPQPIACKTDLQYAVSLTAVLVCYVSALAAWGLQRPCWHDECHFVETIRLFMAHPTLRSLLHYEEMSTPLPFMVYALWGSIFGSSLFNLRILSLIIAACTYLLSYRFFTRVFQRSRHAFWLTVFLMANHYMAGASIFVFTDMLMMLFIIIFLTAIKDRSPVIVLIAGAGGLLCRQYFMFAVAAAFCYSIWRLMHDRSRDELLMTFSLVLSTLPLIALFIFWKGPCPDNSLKPAFLFEPTNFHRGSFTLYVIQLFVYMLPVIIFRLRSIYLDRTRIIIAMALCWLYWLFPVAMTEVGLRAGKHTVGYFHRLLVSWPGIQAEHAVFFACFTLALPVLLSVLADVVKRFRSHDRGYLLFADLSIILFLAVMPFSYLGWEKYFLPLLPIAAVQIMAATSAAERRRQDRGAAAAYSPKT